MDEQLAHLLGRALDALDQANKAIGEARLAVLAAGRGDDAARLAAVLDRTERVAGLHSVRVDRSVA
jgi:hypothetical protein